MSLILSSFFRALGQMGSAAFLKVIFLGAALALALLAALTWAFGQVVFAFAPETMTVPFFGEVGGIAAILSWGGVAMMMVLSVFLMIPVASVFSGLFLDEVADAVETRHYPDLPAPRAMGLYEGLKSGINFMGLVIAVNTVALLFYVLSGPFAPLTFWAVNGYLLGREYFALITQRRLDGPSAKALRKRHWGTVWFAGICMAIPLSIPILNLIIPVLGVATYAHIVQGLRLRGAQAAV